MSNAGNGIPVVVAERIETNYGYHVESVSGQKSRVLFVTISDANGQTTRYALAEQQARALGAEMATREWSE